MSKTLDQLLNRSIKYSMESVTNNEKISEEDKKAIIDALYHRYNDTIRKEIMEEWEEGEREAIKVRLQKEQAESRIRSLILEGIFVAFLTGMLVNQVTEIITYGKERLPWPVWISTFVLLVILSVLVIIYILFVLVKSIISLHKKE